MKRLFLCLLWGFLTLSCNLATAQMVTITKCAESKNIDVESVMNGWYLGRDYEGHDCWLMRTDDGPSSFVEDDDWQVVSLDCNLNVYNRLELPYTNKCSVAAVTTDDASAYMILVDSSESKKTVVLKASVNLDSLTLDSNRIDTVNVITFAKKDRCYIWVASSEDGDYVGMISLLQFTATKKYVAEAVLFDRQLNRLWGKEFPVGTTNGMVVTDEGEIVTMGYELDGAETHFTFNVISARAGDSFGLSLECDRVSDLQMVSLFNRSVICAGLYSSIKSDPREKLVAGTVSMAFDIDSMKITNFMLRPFQNEEVNIFLNKKTKKIQRDREVKMVAPLTSTATSYGAVMAVGHRHVLHYTNANGTVSDTYFAQGIHLEAFDDEGGLKWVRNIRRNDMEKDDEDGMYIALFAEGDTVCLVKSESPKEPSEYDIAKESKEYEVGEKSNLVLYRITENGDVTKTVLEKKTKFSLIGAAKRDDGSVVLITRKGRKIRQVELKLGE